METSQVQRYQIQRAPLPSRTVAYLIDGFLFSILSPIFANVLLKISGIQPVVQSSETRPESFAKTISAAINAGPGSRAALERFESFASMGDSGHFAVNMFAGALATLVLARFQPGKTAMDLKIVDKDGVEARPVVKFARGVMKLFLPVLFVVDVILVFFISGKTIQDYVLGTQVIYAPSS